MAWISDEPSRFLDDFSLSPFCLLPLLNCNFGKAPNTGKHARRRCSACRRRRPPLPRPSSPPPPTRRGRCQLHRSQRTGCRPAGFGDAGRRARGGRQKTRADSQKVVITTGVLRLTFDTTGAQLVQAVLLKYPDANRGDQPAYCWTTPRTCTTWCSRGVVGAAAQPGFPTRRAPFRMVSSRRRTPDGRCAERRVRGGIGRHEGHQDLHASSRPPRHRCVRHRHDEHQRQPERPSACTCSCTATAIIRPTRPASITPSPA